MSNQERPKQPGPDAVGDDSFSHAGKLGIPPEDLETIFHKDPDRAESLTEKRIPEVLGLRHIMEWGDFSREEAEKFLREAAANDPVEPGQDSQGPAS
jgi:hypothetical protein